MHIYLSAHTEYLTSRKATEIYGTSYRCMQRSNVHDDSSTAASDALKKTQTSQTTGADGEGRVV
jgi:hypothetical protein